MAGSIIPCRRLAPSRSALPVAAGWLVLSTAKLIDWPDYDQADAFRFSKVINEPDFMPLHIVRLLCEAAGLVEIKRGKLIASLTPGTVLVREWDQQSHRVIVLADGFAWNGQAFDSLTKVAFAITGTRWNGPRFFGLRNKEECRS